ncbi:response regulator [Bacillus sp. ISL-40]|uniref:response regulator n=1 Tax=unclassified Bacillus (in: firmicutes) TaxID=185979 RepID=UPI001BEAD2A6|nr:MULTISPECIES: response regulator [unclassified Bacillus (in: firmicutes)]MBT2700241.1 response regulator [Bacillus sp. ISL-40]MBT2722841.1 response regulator [Bacillus sp. ISL-46]MBT2740526.1 response regulator [Bacillus sp. ISL-77]
MRYFIVDDDKASRRMLKKIISEGKLGDVVGEAESGAHSLPLILSIRPDVVLIDFLMPNLDGIETIEQLRIQGFQGQFIMISQIENKEIVGEAYEKGVEFFIHKPINRLEVQSILKKTVGQYRLRQSLMTIRESLAYMESDKFTQKQRSVKEIVYSILNDMGIIGESGSGDMVLMMEFLINRNDSTALLPPLKDLYEAISSSNKADILDIKKETKSIEQRIRRAIIAALNNLASLGTLDYTNPNFEYYAPRYFDFQEIRVRMKEMNQNSNEATKVKINIKKFLQVLFLDTVEKYSQTS